MGKHLYINADDSTNWDTRSWITTTIVFHSIFDRVESFFRSDEVACKEKCYEDTGIDGIDLSKDRAGDNPIDKDCFNIFCLRCRTALAHFPDEKWMDYERTKESRRGSSHSVIYEWTEILKRLEMDKRYDPVWIENYQRELGEIK